MIDVSELSIGSLLSMRVNARGAKIEIQLRRLGTSCFAFMAIGRILTKRS